MGRSVWNELDYRIDICRVTKGSHIEHLQLRHIILWFLQSAGNAIYFTVTRYKGNEAPRKGIRASCCKQGPDRFNGCRYNNNEHYWRLCDVRFAKEGCQHSTCSETADHTTHPHKHVWNSRCSFLPGPNLHSRMTAPIALAQSAITFSPYSRYTLFSICDQYGDNWFSGSVSMICTERTGSAVQYL
jgi:hypothetical protein